MKTQIVLRMRSAWAKRQAACRLKAPWRYWTFDEGGDVIKDASVGASPFVRYYMHKLANGMR